MQVFVIRAWGFDPERWPFITFSSEDNRDRLLTESSLGDRVVIVGTLRQPTPEQMRGKLLGMAEIGRIPFDTADIYGEAVRAKRVNDEESYFLWPKALPMLRAWRFTATPRLVDLLEGNLSYHTTYQAIALSQTDAISVLQLSATLVKLATLDSSGNPMLPDQVIAPTSPTTGPKPSSWISEVGRYAEREAFTYAFQFGSSNIWKIGHTVNINDRIKQVNCHIPVELIAEKWNAKFWQRWYSEVDAYDMEQRVLKILESYRTEGERVRCSEETLWSAWLKGICA